MTEREGPLRDVRDALGEVTRRLEALAASVARLAPPGPPVGELLDEGERRRLAPLESLLAIGPDLEPEAALLLAVDRVIHAAGADCAAVFVQAPGGDLEAAAHRGFGAAAPRLPLGQGIVGRAWREGEAIRARPAHQAVDPFLSAHGLAEAIALPVGAGPDAALGVVFAGRRRPAAFAADALEVLRLLADRVALVLRTRTARGPASALGQDLDLAGTAARVARELAGRLGAPRLAVLLPDGGTLRVAATVGIPVDRVPPPADADPLAAVLATGRAWTGTPELPEALAGFLGAPAGLVLPLVACDAVVGLVLAGGPAPLSAGLAADVVPVAAHALRNARLHAETRAALAEQRARERRPPAAVAAPARDLVGLLAVLLARIGLVRERLTDDALAADLGVAEEAAWQAAEAVRGFLGFAPGARSGELRPLDLGPVLLGAVDEARGRSVARGGAPDIRVELEPLPPVRASAEEMAEALGHVLDNAAEAIGPGETITVRARWDGGSRVDVLVEDRGSGMDEAVRIRALEPFFSTRGPGRLGVGLAVVQAIVTRHRGALELSSAPGEGTRVRLTLPTAARRAEPPGNGIPPRVLIIEDEAAVREALAGVLGQHGHVALAAADGEEGLAIIQREVVDVVIADLALPGRSGLEVARAVKRIRPGTPVILITAWPGRLDATAVEASGVERVIEKPADAAQVVEAVEALLAARREAAP